MKLTEEKRTGCKNRSPDYTEERGFYMRLGELCKETGILCPPEDTKTEIVAIRTLASAVEKGDLFVCLCGGQHDGHDYIPEAIARGAACVIAERGRELPVVGVPLLRVRNTRKTLARLCAAFYGHPERTLTVVGVTGTNGKTSVAHMLYAILREGDIPCGLIGTTGVRTPAGELPIHPDDPLANMTTPDPGELFRVLACMREEGATHVVMEVSSHALALRKVDPIRFRIGVFTNLSPEHLDMHGDMEHYFWTKARLFGHCQTGVINTADAYGRRLYDAPGMTCRRISCSASLGADYTVTDVSCGLEGVRYRLLSGSLCVQIKCPVSGVFTVQNSAEAAVCALEMGIPAQVIRRALEGFCGVPGRMERVLLPGADFTVLIDYAHTPDALEKLLLSVRQMRRRQERILLLFGCGGDRDRSKRRRMGQIASRLADFLIITSDNSRSEDPGSIIDEIIKGIDRERAYIVLPDRRDAIRYAVSVAGSGDILLLAGKGHEHYEIDRTGRHPFCEREQLLAAWRLRGES